MLKFKLKLIIVTVTITCAINSFMHGMKRHADIECVLPANGELLPQETLEIILTHVCEALINTPLFVQKSKQTIFNFNLYFSGNSQWRITPNGNIAYLAIIRSVCKQWYDLLNPSEIKCKLSINTDDVIADLGKIKVTGNQKNHFHAQFLAQMIKGHIVHNNDFKNLLPNIIRSDPDRLKILLENGLIDLNCYLKEKHGNDSYYSIPQGFLLIQNNSLFPSPLGCCLVIQKDSWGDDDDYEYSYLNCYEKSFRLLLDHGADVYQEIGHNINLNINLLDVLLSSSHTSSSVNKIIQIIAEKIPLNRDYQDRISKRNIIRNWNDKNENEVRQRYCCFSSCMGMFIFVGVLSILLHSLSKQ